MDEMTSTEFRKRYAKIDRPTRVTVLGRVIGEWHPRDIRPLTPAEAIDAATERTYASIESTKAAIATRLAGERTFGHPRPAPKKPK